jgi:hypothetical protein
MHGFEQLIVQPVDFARFVDDGTKAGCYRVPVNRLPGASAGTSR